MKSDLDYTPNDEVRLLLSVSRGDELAFRILFDRYRDRVYSLAMYLTRSDCFSVDIVQEVFVKVWVNRKELADVKYFNAWLRTIARNTIKNYLRGMARERVALQDISVITTRSVPSSENSLVEKHYQQKLLEAIERLPPQQKRVYLLSRQAGLKNIEIATQMNISIYTVKEYLAKALNALRGQLASKLNVILLAGIILHIW